MHIGETGFGTGLNLLTLLKQIEESPFSGVSLQYSSIELYPLDSGRIHQLLSPFTRSLAGLLPLYESYWESFYPALKEGWNHAKWLFPGLELTFNLYKGNALQWSKEEPRAKIQAWFLDGHSPEKNPEIWSLPVMKAVYENTAPGGTLASFSAAGIVKRALRDAGFLVKRKKGFGTKRHMIQGFKS